MKPLLFVIAGLGLFCGAGLSTAIAQKAPSERPTDEQILTAQINYYGLLVQRLTQDLAEAKAGAAERDKAWAEYSKPLWEAQQHSEITPAQSVPTAR